MSEDLAHCHCFCGFVHGDEMGICTDGGDIALVEMRPNPYARRVPMCLPCRMALYERTGGRQG